ncbi:MAG: HDIG domain-containing metalloprotein [Dysgonomonas sp.]
MDVVAIIEKYYKKDTELYCILMNHSTDVTRKALDMAENHPELGVDVQFVAEAAMLHDIGILWTDAHSIQCFGSEPYIRHGVIGHDLLLDEGLPRHALVCERHTGAGLTKEEIVLQKLPLPHRDMMPLSVEEQLICFADCFFSKTNLGKEKTVEKVKIGLSRFSERSLHQFDEWCKMFL